MPYELDWLDEDRRILAIHLYDPLQPDEVEALHRELMPVAAAPAPLFVLADVRELDLIAAYSRLGSALSALSIPALSEENVRKSRLAVVGGGPLVSLVLGLAKGAGNGEDLVQAFKHEDEAYSWLSGQASGGADG